MAELIRYVTVDVRTLEISIENYEKRGEKVRFIIPELIRKLPTGSYMEVETCTVITEKDA